MAIRLTTRGLKVLDFDLENRPLSYWYDGQCTSEITAIAASWMGSNHVYVWLLGQDDPTMMLDDFGTLYDEADMVTGHYIRKHDLPIVNGAMMEMGLQSLDPILTQDTKEDLVKRGGLSASQEALSAMFHLSNPKHHMTQEDWRDANRLTKEGLEKTRMRVVSDIVQHKQLRQELLDRGLLKKPRYWRP